MVRKNTLGAIFIIVGLIFLLAPISFNITGNTIAENFQIDFYYFYIIGIIFLFTSIIFFVSRQSLDAIVIPTGGGEFDSEEKMYSQDRDRAEKALRRKNRLDEGGYFVISGIKHNDEQVKGGQSNSIYKYLRRHGVKPSEIMVEGKSHDTLENVIYSLKKIKEREEKRHGKIKRPIRIGFVSYPEHLGRFEDFEKKAIRKGLIEEDDFKFYKIRTFSKWGERKEQRNKEKEYESSPLRKLYHRYKLNTLGKYIGKSGRIKHAK